MIKPVKLTRENLERRFGRTRDQIKRFELNQYIDNAIAA